MLNSINNLLIGQCLFGLAMVTLHCVHNPTESHTASILQVLCIVQIGLAYPSVIQISHLLLLIMFRSFAVPGRKGYFTCLEVLFHRTLNTHTTLNALKRFIRNFNVFSHNLVELNEHWKSEVFSLELNVIIRNTFPSLTSSDSVTFYLLSLTFISK